MAQPSIVHLGQVCVDMALAIDHMPERGGDCFADSQTLSAGGGFNVLYAARQMGAPAAYAGALGQGAMADIAARALRDIDVPCTGAVVTGQDTGISVAMTESDGERTFVSTRGAETMVPVDTYEQLAIEPGSVVYLTGYSLVHAANAEAIRRFVRKYREHAGFTALFDPSPVVSDIALDDLETMRSLHPIWSVNEREAGILCERFGLDCERQAGDCSSDSGGEAHRASGGTRKTNVDAQRCEELAQYLGSWVIVRVGAQGAWVCDGRAVNESVETDPHAAHRASLTCDGQAMGKSVETHGGHGYLDCGRCDDQTISESVETAEVGAAGIADADGFAGSNPDDGIAGIALHIPAHRVTAVDTNGAGDTHAGVLCAMLLEGRPMLEAVRLANCAAAMSVCERGPATCPGRERLLECYHNAQR